MCDEVLELVAIDHGLHAFDLCECMYVEADKGGQRSRNKLLILGAAEESDRGANGGAMVKSLFSEGFHDLIESGFIR